MSFKNTILLISTMFICACASTNVKESDSSVSSSPLVIKNDIIFEKGAVDLHRSDSVFIFNENKSTEIRLINNKKVPHPFIGKEYHKFVVLPGTVSLTVDYIGGFDLDLPRYKATLAAGKRYILITEEEEETNELTTVYFALYDVDSKERIRLMDGS